MDVMLDSLLLSQKVHDLLAQRLLARLELPCADHNNSCSE